MQLGAERGTDVLLAPFVLIALGLLAVLNSASAEDVRPESLTSVASSAEVAQATQPDAAKPAAPPAPEPPRERQPGFTGPSPVRPTPIQTSPDFVPILDRWRIGLPDWNRYERPMDAPYTRGQWWNPYNQNLLKGDYPISGQNHFLTLSAISDTLLEFRRIPVGTQPSSSSAGQAEFFGNGDQIFFNQNFIFSAEFFRGNTAFKPRDYEFRITPVFNISYLDTNETGIVNIDTRRGSSRRDDHASLQELFIEYHLGDISPYYDFISTRSGIQAFTSDFRGFIFSDNQLGFRLFGNLGSNQNQFNVTYFRPLEKDTNSGLNRIFATREQHLGIVNYFRQDFIWPGYTLMFNLHILSDSGEELFDDNGFLVRPAAVGTLARKNVDAYWLGWNGDGHIGRLNLTHSFYQVVGQEVKNPINNRGNAINAQMAAVEASVDLDYVRPRISFFYASGDRKPLDNTARAFDSIFDNANFAGAGFSYWVRQELPLTNTGLTIKGRQSLIPDLRSSKIHGQPNFIGPGVFLLNVGADFDLTPKLKLITNVNFLRFEYTKVLEDLLFLPKVRHDIGIDYSAGVRWRPLLINNFIVTAGVAALTPGDGLRDILTSRTFKVTNQGLVREQNFPYDTFYSAFLSVTLTY